MSMVIGIDFGNTITYKPAGATSVVPFPDALRVVKALASKYPCYIISKVNAQQKVDVLTWLVANDFFNQVGIPESNLHFCEERHQKNAICVRLGVTHHIDDRPEVVHHLNNDIKAFLFRPIAADVVSYFYSLKTKDVCIVQDWKEIESYLLPPKPSFEYCQCDDQIQCRGLFQHTCVHCGKTFDPKTYPNV